MRKEAITMPGYQGGLGGRAWSPGIKMGPWLFLSGITPVDYSAGESVGRGPAPNAMTPGSVEPEAQWRQVLGNIKAVLESVGGSMADVVSAHVFVTDMHFYYQYEWIRREYFVEPFPVCTALEVGSLVHPDWVLEIECTAYLDGEEERA
jgi:enamine deaminase RidA (YjgF/YER057c/UK114 family)